MFEHSLSNYSAFLTSSESIDLQLKKWVTAWLKRRKSFSWFQPSGRNSEPGNWFDGTIFLNCKMQDIGSIAVLNLTFSSSVKLTPLKAKGADPSLHRVIYPRNRRNSLITSAVTWSPGSVRLSRFFTKTIPDPSSVKYSEITLRAVSLGSRGRRIDSISAAWKIWGRW